MTSADSMKVDTTVVYYTVKGRKVYGGGGIIPDVFVPIDTTKATTFHINCNKKATAMRFASAMFDKYRNTLTRISSFDQLQTYLSGLSLDRQFLDYAAKVDGFTPGPGEWEQTCEYMMPQIYGLVGRFSKVGEEAFYRFYLPIDETIKVAIEQ
jgi:carboxyl-terminal processing protease